MAARGRLETALALAHKCLHPLFDVEDRQHLAVEFQCHRMRNDHVISELQPLSGCFHLYLSLFNSIIEHSERIASDRSHTTIGCAGSAAAVTSGRTTERRGQKMLYSCYA